MARPPVAAATRNDNAETDADRTSPRLSPSLGGEGRRTSPVLLPAGLGRLCTQWGFLPLADRHDAFVGDPERYQIAPDGRRSSLAEGQVVLGRTPFIRVPFDHDAGGRPAAQPRVVSRDRLACVVAEVGTVVVEAHGTERMLTVQIG